MTTMNPFLVQSTLPYLAPHFDQIANHHYRPAFDEEYSKAGRNCCHRA